MAVERIIEGDAATALRTLTTGSVHCVVTSPPYWGLRDYGTATWVGGKSGHGHTGSVARVVSGGQGKQYSNVGSTRVYSGNCLCGARRTDAQLGLEATPEEYVGSLVAVFREVRRVLRDDGTVWLNLGDSYVANTVSEATYLEYERSRRVGKPFMGRSVEVSAAVASFDKGRSGLKPKNLVGIPWRVALALQADGWYLRSDIIWAKPNPMPDSVRDRPTKSHEYVFLLTKSERYYYDGIAIQEPLAWPNVAPTAFDYANLKQGGGLYNPQRFTGRNARSVWRIQPNRETNTEGHFAVMPTELAKRCILAGTSERGACVACLAPWHRDARRERSKDSEQRSKDEPWQVGSFRGDGHGGYRGSSTTLCSGWSRSCGCARDVATTPCTVLDPFLGSGTTAVVARDLGRGFIGLEISRKYIDIARRRLADHPRRARLFERWEV